MAERAERAELEAEEKAGADKATVAAKPAAVVVAAMKVSVTVGAVAVTALVVWL